MYTIEEIKTLANEYAKKISLENIPCTWEEENASDNCPYIKIDSSGLHYMVKERGVVLENDTTNDVDELLYWIFSTATFVLAHEYENKNREALKDIRRLIHSKQLELLEKLNPKWHDLEEQKHEQILVKHPYDDFASIRASYSGELRKKGYSEIEIKRKAYEKYPQ